MCSATSPTDHTSGAGLKLHWSADRPWIEARNAARVSFRCRIALWRSASLKVSADAQPAASRVIPRKRNMNPSLTG